MISYWIEYSGHPENSGNFPDQSYFPEQSGFPVRPQIPHVSPKTCLTMQGEGIVNLSGTALWQPVRLPAYTLSWCFIWCTSGNMWKRKEAGKIKWLSCLYAGATVSVLTLHILHAQMGQWGLCRYNLAHNIHYKRYLSEVLIQGTWSHFSNSIQ